MSEPRVAVLTPAYRSEATIRQAIASALGQTLGDIEVIVCDDASPVPVAEVLADLRDPRLRILRRRRNGGSSAARTTALKVSRAPIVAQLDADDWWEPGYLAAVTARFADPAVGVVYTNGMLVGMAGDQAQLFESAEGHPIASFDALAGGNLLRTPGTCLRRAPVVAMGGWPARIRICGDWHVYLELLLAGWRFAYVDELLFHYRVPDYSRHSYSARELERDELRMWLGLCLRHPRLLGRPELRWRVRRELGQAVG